MMLIKGCAHLRMDLDGSSECTKAINFYRKKKLVLLF